jgi:hypothetical protein
LSPIVSAGDVGLKSLACVLLAIKVIFIKARFGKFRRVHIVFIVTVPPPDPFSRDTVIDNVKSVLWKEYRLGFIVDHTIGIVIKSNHSVDLPRSESVMDTALRACENFHGLSAAM